MNAYQRHTAKVIETLTVHSVFVHLAGRQNTISYIMLYETAVGSQHTSIVTKQIISKANRSESVKARD